MKRILFLWLALVLTVGAQIRQTDRLLISTNKTDATVIDPQSLTVLGYITLGGVRRSTWPSGGGGSDTFSNSPTIRVTTLGDGSLQFAFTNSPGYITTAALALYLTNNQIGVSLNGGTVATTAITNGITLAGLGGVTSSITNNLRSPHIVIASLAGCYLNASLASGGGSNDTAAMQAVLNTSTNGPLLVVVDGVARVSGLTLFSNTKLLFLPGAGLYRSDNSETNLIQTAHAWSRNGIDSNIIIEGGTFNANRDGNPLTKNHATVAQFVAGETMRLVATSNLTVRGVTILNSATFAIALSDWNQAVLENIRVVSGTAETATDAFHANGPGTELTLRNIWSDCDDDMVRLNPDEHSAGDLVTYPYLSNGGITNAVVDGVTCAGTHSGVGIGSQVYRAQNITIRNVRGKVGAFAIGFDTISNLGGGNIGDVHVSDVSVATQPDWLDWSNDYKPGSNIVSLAATVENLWLDGIGGLQITDGRPIYYRSPLFGQGANKVYINGLSAVISNKFVTYTGEPLTNVFVTAVSNAVSGLGFQRVGSTFVLTGAVSGAGITTLVYSNSNGPSVVGTVGIIGTNLFGGGSTGTTYTAGAGLSLNGTTFSLSSTSAAYKATVWAGNTWNYSAPLYVSNLNWVLGTTTEGATAWLDPHTFTVDVASNWLYATQFSNAVIYAISGKLGPQITTNVFFLTNATAYTVRFATNMVLVVGMGYDASNYRFTTVGGPQFTNSLGHIINVNGIYQGASLVLTNSDNALISSNWFEGPDNSNPGTPQIGAYTAYDYTTNEFLVADGPTYTDQFGTEVSGGQIRRAGTGVAAMQSSLNSTGQTLLALVNSKQPASAALTNLSNGSGVNITTGITATAITAGVLPYGRVATNFVSGGVLQQGSDSNRTWVAPSTLTVGNATTSTYATAGLPGSILVTLTNNVTSITTNLPAGYDWKLKYFISNAAPVSINIYQTFTNETVNGNYGGAYVGFLPSASSGHAPQPFIASLSGSTTSRFVNGTSEIRWGNGYVHLDTRYYRREVVNATGALWFVTSRLTPLTNDFLSTTISYDSTNANAIGATSVFEWIPQQR